MKNCIVSAYYKIPSKQPHEWYLPFLIHWFMTIRGNIIFFTTLDVVEELKCFLDISHVKFYILPFEDLIANLKGIEFWNRQYARDVERYHSPQLGMIWYEKRHFVYKAMQLDTEADIFIWCDAGCIRNNISENAAKYFATRMTSLNDTKMHLQQVNRFEPKEFCRYPDFCIAGAIMAGNRIAWIQFIDIYEKSLDEYDQNEIPGIMDQNIMHRCVLNKSELFTLYPQESTVDPWFKFLEFL
jgi:hypothetical protein